jgi:GTPase
VWLHAAPAAAAPAAAGAAVTGTVKRGVITPNTPLLLGPDIGDGSFKSASIKSIHYKVGQLTSWLVGSSRHSSQLHVAA